MIKLEHDGVIYYFANFNVLYGAINDDGPWKRRDLDTTRLLQFANFAVQDDTIIKNRFPVTELIEAYIEKTENGLQ